MNTNELFAMKETLPTPLVPGSVNGEQTTDGRTLNWIVVVSTAIGFAAALGTTACLERSADGRFDFHWHWRAVIWMALGIAAAIQLWRLLWRAQNDTSGKAAKKLKLFCILLLAGGLAVFFYPIFFLRGKNFDDVLTGMSLAAGAITLVGFLISRVMKGFLEEDAENLPGK
jgi:hypothetical protein